MTDPVKSPQTPVSPAHQAPATPLPATGTPAKATSGTGPAVQAAPAPQAERTGFQKMSNKA